MTFHLTFYNLNTHAGNNFLFLSFTHLIIEWLIKALGFSETKLSLLCY